MIFKAFYDKLKNDEILPKITSGISDEKPRCVIDQISCNLVTRNTCVSRHESHVYRFRFWTTNHTILKDYLARLQEILDYKEITIVGSILENLQWINTYEEEVEESLYFGSTSYLVETQKIFSSRYDRGITEGKNIQEALFNRYKAHEWENKVLQFVTTAFSQVNRPRIIIPNLQELEAWYTTCSRVKNTRFQLLAEHYSPTEVEALLTEIDELFSYARLKIKDDVLNVEWLGCEIEEQEQGLWLGANNYQIAIEKGIT